MCPNNPLGTTDVLIVGHHGLPSSNAEVIVHALRPRVSIINNGTRKGGQPEAMRIILNSPGLEDVWQMHFSLLGGQEYTVPGMFIANTIDDQPDSLPISPWTRPPQGQQVPPAPVHDGKAYWFKPGFPFCPPKMDRLYIRKPQRPRESSSSHIAHRPGSEAVTQPALTCSGLEIRASRAFRRHRFSLVSSRCQAGVLALAARQPAGTGSAQIL